MEHDEQVFETDMDYDNLVEELTQAASLATTGLATRDLMTTAAEAIRRLLWQNESLEDRVDELRAELDAERKDFDDPGMDQLEWERSVALDDWYE